MAPPKNPWTGRKNTQLPQLNAFPGLSGQPDGPKTGSPKKSVEEVAGPALQYDKIQEDEVEVLKSIYMDDYEHIDKSTAWKVCLTYLRLISC
jgi:RWD domain